MSCKCHSGLPPPPFCLNDSNNWDEIQRESPHDSDYILVRVLKAPLSSTREGCEMELRGWRNQEVVSVCHHHESFKILNRAVQHQSCPHKSISSFHLLAVLMPALIHTHTSSSPGEVINAITSRVTEVSAGHGPLSILQSHGQLQRWRSSSRVTVPAVASPQSRRLNLFSPSVCVFCPDPALPWSLCKGCGSPDCE